MVVIRGGFRDRWNTQSANRRSSNDTVDEQPSDAEEPLYEEDCSFQHVDFQNDLDTDLLGSDDLVDLDCEHLEPDVSDIRPQFLKPAPKSRPQPADTSGEFKSCVQRTADELWSHLMHKQIHDLKQPWQRGPLTGLFTRPKSFWERMSSSSATSLVGLSDHVTAADSSSSITKQ